MTEPTLLNDEYAKLELQIATRHHLFARVEGDQLKVMDAGSGWYKHPGYLLNLCRVAKVMKANNISVIHAGTEWTAMTTSVICTSPHLEVAVWTVFLNLPLEGAIK